MKSEDILIILTTHSFKLEHKPQCIQCLIFKLSQEFVLTKHTGQILLCIYVQHRIVQYIYYLYIILFFVCVIFVLLDKGIPVVVVYFSDVRRERVFFHVFAVWM